MGATEINKKYPRIQKLWFADNHIWIVTEDGSRVGQPLEAFPALFLATPEERENYYLWDDYTSIRWEKLDEDIHVSNFSKPERVNYDNEVNRLLSRFPWLDLKGLAQYLGMHWTKLARFRYGVWTPSPETLAKIKNGIRAIGKEMSAAVL